MCVKMHGVKMPESQKMLGVKMPGSKLSDENAILSFNHYPEGYNFDKLAKWRVG